MTITERVSSVAEGEARLKEISHQIADAVHSKSLRGQELKNKMDQLEAEYEATERGIQSYRRAMQFRAGSEIGQPPEPPREGELVLGKQLNPLSFDYADLKMCAEAMSNRQSFQCRVKSGGDFMANARTKTPGVFSSPVSLQPPEVWPLVVGPVHENRILDRLPATQVSSPSIEFVRHDSSTGTPAIVAEGATKPEILFNTSKLILPMLKAACHLAISWESMTDPAGSGLQSWMGYVQGELFKEVMDFENKQLLTGVGGSSSMLGFFSTPGILTHDASADTGTGVTSLDSVEESIARMRTAAALAEPNLFITHPVTWSAMRRTKDGFQRFLIAPDPTQDESKRLWGLDVLTTIACPLGQGLLIDTTKFGFAAIREALVMRVGYDSGDFTANLQRIVIEERLNLAVVRPTAILALANLPYTGGS
jgi:HK97 family phage major capsid protein